MRCSCTCIPHTIRHITGKPLGFFGVTMRQLWLQAEGKIDLNETHKKLRDCACAKSVKYSGGGRGNPNGTFDCGNLCVEFHSLPGAKFQVMHSGQVQVWLPDLNEISYSSAECMSRILDHLVASDGEELHGFFVLNDTSVVDQPKPASTTEELLTFYRNVRSNLAEECYIVDKILEVLESGKKAVVFVTAPKYRVRLKHDQTLFLGEWTEEEKQEFNTRYHYTLGWENGDYEVVLPPKFSPVRMFPKFRHQRISDH